jgi:hypothetical protein
MVLPEVVACGGYCCCFLVFGGDGGNYSVLAGDFHYYGIGSGNYYSVLLIRLLETLLFLAIK